MIKVITFFTLSLFSAHLLAQNLDCQVNVDRYKGGKSIFGFSEVFNRVKSYESTLTVQYNNQDQIITIANHIKVRFSFGTENPDQLIISVTGKGNSRVNRFYKESSRLFSLDSYDEITGLFIIDHYRSIRNNPVIFYQYRVNVLCHQT